MAKISKQVGNRLAIKENVRSSVKSHREAMVEAVERVLFEGQAPEKLTVGEFVDALTGRLDATHDAFAKLEQQLTVERGQDSRARARRDQEAEGLRRALIRVRGVIESFWGPKAAAHAGFVGVTPQVHRDLVVYAQNVEALLADGIEESEPGIGLTLPDVAELREAIRKQRVALEAGRAALTAEERETQDLQNRRDQAVEAWNKTYIPVANIVEHLFRLADMHAWADQVRPTARRRAGIAEPADLEALSNDVEIEEDEPAVVVAPE